MFVLKSDVFLRKKSPRQGRTKPKTELGMHQNPHFQQNLSKINKSPKINHLSTITIPESACGLVGNLQHAACRHDTGFRHGLFHNAEGCSLRAIGQSH